MFIVGGPQVHQCASRQLPHITASSSQRCLLRMQHVQQQNAYHSHPLHQSQPKAATCANIFLRQLPALFDHDEWSLLSGLLSLPGLRVASVGGAAEESTRISAIRGSEGASSSLIAESLMGGADGWVARHRRGMVFDGKGARLVARGSVDCDRRV